MYNSVAFGITGLVGIFGPIIISMYLNDNQFKWNNHIYYESNAGEIKLSRLPTLLLQRGELDSSPVETN